MTDNALSLPSREAGLSLLEHLHADTSKICERIGGSAPLLLAVNRTEKTATYMQANCNMWDCVACGSRKASQWIARIIQGIKVYGGQWYFATITAHGKWRGQERSLINLRQGWRKLYNRLLRLRGNFHYVKIFEHHADGSLHLHLLTDIALPYKSSMKFSKKSGKFARVYRCKLLKRLSAECGMGFKADYQPLENAGLAAWYVAKYLGKSIGVADFPSNVRRIQCSHKWLVLPKLYADLELEWSHCTSRTDMLFKSYNLWRTEDILTHDAIADTEITSDDWEKILYER